MKMNNIGLIFASGFSARSVVKRGTGLMLLIFAFSALGTAQDDISAAKKPTDQDKTAAFDQDGKIRRGAQIGKSKEVPMEKIFEDPAKYAEKMVRVNGYVVRSCKKEGCWAEIGATRDASQTVRVKMKDHAFFIPLQSAGFKVLAEGVFSVKTLSKDEVEHMVEEDGAKFASINSDGTVTEISFLASGVELSKP